MMHHLLLLRLLAAHQVGQSLADMTHFYWQHSLWVATRQCKSTGIRLPHVILLHIKLNHCTSVPAVICWLGPLDLMLFASM